MATRNATTVCGADDTCVVTWTGITEADSGVPVVVTNLYAKTVQAVGDFTTSGAITMQGSNDGSNWFTLRDMTGSAIVLTSATDKATILDNPLYVRPLATAGSSVSMDVILVGYRA